MLPWVPSYYSRHDSRFTLGIDPPLQPTFEFLQVKTSHVLVLQCAENNPNDVLRELGNLEQSCCHVFLAVL